MKNFFNVVLLALFCTSCAQVQVGKTFEFTYEGQTLKYVVADGNEAKVSKQQSERISGDVKIPERVKFAGKKYTVTSIGEAAFDNCDGLTSVTIPNSVTTIGKYAFSDCTSLTLLTIENATPPEVRGFAFEGVSENITIYVPAESVEKYKTARVWSEYADKIKAIEK
jgi:hypothetical protein